MDSPIRPTLLSLLTLTACACSERPLTDSPDAADTSGDPADTGESDESETGMTGGPTDLPEPEPFDCAEACATLADGGCLTPDACVATCASESPDWPEPVREAFVACVATDPLCFTSLDQCLVRTLHPEGSEFPLALMGVGFDAYDGLEIQVWHDPDVPPSFGGSATIVDGAFTFAWVEPVFASTEGGPLLLWYVDVDGDQACTADDLGTFVNLVWNQDLLAPAFAAEVEPPATTTAAVCDFLP